MDNQIQIESKYLTATKEELIIPPIYSTRKSSRRLNQINLNSDFILDSTILNLQSLKENSNAKDLKELQQINEATSTTKNHSSPNSSSTNLTATNQVAANQIAANLATLNNQQNPTAAKQQRKWEQWQIDDTRWFFEALNEHGKDFNAIHNYMTNRSKKKGVAEELIKNKEQIRCYFNRQWNKICQTFECNDEHEFSNLDKATKQLYALINYGEMWKKNDFKNDLKIDAKFKAHLNELVFKGYTFLKIGKKGKNIKLKTPVCKALKKIYYFETIYKSINQNLPKDILIELIPASNYAWMKVHCLSQNPRVRIKCALQKRLSNLIKFIEERWNEQKYNNLQIESLTKSECMKSPKNENKQNDELASVVGSNISNVSNSINSLNDPNNLSNNTSNLDCSSSRKIFRVKPHSGHHKNLTGLKFTRIQPVPFNSQMDISLSAYLLKANSKLIDQKKKGKNLGISCSKKSNAKEDENKNNDKLADELKSLNNHAEKSNTSHVLETVRELNLLNNIVSLNYKENQNDVDKNNERKLANQRQISNQLHEEKSLHLPGPPPNATIGEWLSANLNKNDDCLNLASKEEEELIKDDELVKEDELAKEIQSLKKTESQAQENIFNKMRKIVDPLTIKNGWSSDEIEDLTIGELYLMLKKPIKIVLQYDWNIATEQQQQESIHENTKDLKTSNSIQSNGQCTSTATTNHHATNHLNHTTNYPSLVSKLISAFTMEVMSLNREKDYSIEIENECLGKSNNLFHQNTTKNNRKTKKLKTNHSVDDNHIESNGHFENNNCDNFEQISTLANLSSDLELTANRITKQASTSKSDDKNDKTTTSSPSSSTTEKFAIPCSPVLKPASKQNNKGRIVNEQLLQEAKEQLNNNIIFNSARRNIRKPGKCYLLIVVVINKKNKFLIFFFFLFKKEC